MRKIMALACLAMAVSHQLRAEDFNYSYIDAQYTTSNIDVGGLNLDSKGYAIGGSVALSENIALTAGYEDETVDSTYLLGFDIDMSSFDFGIDYHAPVAPTTDVVIGFGVMNAEVSMPIISEDDTGNVISAELRHRLAPKAELNIGVSRVDIFDDSSTNFGFALLVEIINDFHFGIGYGSSDDIDSIGFGIRAGF